MWVGVGISLWVGTHLYSGSAWLLLGQRRLAGVSFSDITVDVCKPGDIVGDLSLEVRLVQVNFAILL